jgi:hypothetical protein
MMIILLTDFLCLKSQTSGTYKIVAKAEAESICALIAEPHCCGGILLVIITLKLQRSSPCISGERIILVFSLTMQVLKLFPINRTHDDQYVYPSMLLV